MKCEKMKAITFILLLISIAAQAESPRSLKDLAAEQYVRGVESGVIRPTILPQAALEVSLKYYFDLNLAILNNEDPYTPEQDYYAMKAARLDQLMYADSFIPLNQNDAWKTSNSAIAAIGMTEAFLVELLGRNPSDRHGLLDFRIRFCADEYRELMIRGVRVGMCPSFPASGTSFIDNEKILVDLNLVYEKAGRPDRFRMQSIAEYSWADTVGGQKPKREHDRDLWKYANIANDERQRSVFANKPNPLGFRRSGVWEWTSDWYNSQARNLIGASYRATALGAASGALIQYDPTVQYETVGPSRLVRTR